MAGPKAEYEDGPAEGPRTVALTLGPETAGERLDKALAAAAAGHPDLSRSRLGQLIAEGAVTGPDGATVTGARQKVKPGRWTVSLPAPVPAEPQPEDIPLRIVHEDADLIVVDKPAGMVVHPAPGAESRTLVNALLHHCGVSLTGIGGVGRPGIVHRIDKETSGLLVVAKTAAAHAGLSALFAAHDVERRYLAVLRGAPDRGNPRLVNLPGVSISGGAFRIDRPIGRHPVDRKRMAVRDDGRHAITHLRVVERFPSAGRAAACLAECRLETGRTHQIRVHAARVGHPLIGDPVYGRGRSGIPGADVFPRQALHAATLGFVHPITGHALSFGSPLPADMAELLTVLRCL